MLHMQPQFMPGMDAPAMRMQLCRPGQYAPTRVLSLTASMQVCSETDVAWVPESTFDRASKP